MSKSHVTRHTGFITFRRVVKTGLLNFFRNFSLSVAATAVMTVTLTIVLFFVIANATFHHTIEDINDKIKISVYLKDGTPEDSKEQLLQRLRGLQNVESVDYISKDQALTQYREDNKDKLDLLLAVSQAENPIPATIQIKPKDPSKNEEIRKVLETPEIKALQSDDTSYSGDRKDAIDKITAATVFFRKAALASVVVFAFISMLIIFNTIQMAIFNRRDELRIMRLLGASSWFIRGPFVVETMFYGVVSGILSIVITNLLFVVQAQAFDANSLGLLDINYANKYFGDNFFIFLAMQIGFGMLIGAISAMIATKRFLQFSNKSKILWRHRQQTL